MDRGAIDYDALGRLTAFRDAPTSVAIEAYGYDATGNRTSFTDLSGTQAYTYPGTSHRLSSVASTARTYDAAGNTLTAGDRSYSYNAAGRMATSSLSGSLAGTYTYTGAGEQVKRVAAGVTTLFVYDEAGQLLGQFDSLGQPLQQFLRMDSLPVGVLAGGQLLHVQSDHLGTPRSVIDPARNVPVWTWPIIGEAFGATAPNEDPDLDGTGFVFDLRFPGQRFDAASGLSQNYFRDYESLTGRYPTSDPIGLQGGHSTYTYVTSKPLQLTDRLGLACDQRGCWNTVKELGASAKGDWETYYMLACSGGDPYACRAGEVAANTGVGLRGVLSEITNRKLAVSIVMNQPSICPQNVRTEDLLRKMESIRLGLMRARVAQLGGANPLNPLQVNRGEIADFHHDVFERNGAGADAFGGDLMDSIPGSRQIYNWCEAPSCKN